MTPRESRSGWKRGTTDDLARMLGEDHPAVRQMREQDQHRRQRSNLDAKLWEDPRVVRASRLRAEHHPDLVDGDLVMVGRELLRASARVLRGEQDRGATPQELVAAARGAFEAVLDHGYTGSSTQATWEVQTRMSLWAGIAAGLQGDDDAATEHLERSARAASRMHAPRMTGRAHEEIAELHRARGDGKAASRAAARAARAYREADDTYRLGLLRAAMQRDWQQSPAGMLIDDSPSGLTATVLGSAGGVLLRTHLLEAAVASLTAADDTATPTNMPGVEGDADTDAHTDADVARWHPDPDIVAALRDASASGASLGESATQLAQSFGLPDVLRAAFEVDGAATLCWAQTLATSLPQQATVIGALASAATPQQLAALTVQVPHPDPAAMLLDIRSDPAWVLAVLSAGDRVHSTGLATIVERCGTRDSIRAWADEQLIDDELVERLAALEDRRAYHQAAAVRSPARSEVERWVSALARFGLDRTVADLNEACVSLDVCIEVLRSAQIAGPDALAAVVVLSGRGQSQAADHLLAAGWELTGLAAAIARGRRWATCWRWLLGHLHAADAVEAILEAGATSAQLLDVVGPKRRDAVAALRAQRVPDATIAALLRTSGLDESAVQRQLRR